MKDEYVLFNNKKSETEPVDMTDVVVILCFYYKESFDEYFDRIKPVTEIADTFLITSSSIVLERAQDIALKDQCSKMKVIEKPNRGRDISALLVTAKDIIKNYKYICFYHDKTSKNQHTSEYAHNWEATLFDNTICNHFYVRNVIDYFKADEQLGLLLPPEPLGEYHYFDYWLDNYENTVDLAKNLELNVVPDRNENPISVGTTFWARRDALEKLFDYDWKYESFVDEPLPSDGTISHAVERVLPYVVQDAGYTSKIMMNNEYACKHLSEKKDEQELSMKILEKEFGILTPRQLNGFYETIERIKELRKKKDKLYIYGTGMFGRACARMLDRFGIEYDGYVETRKNKASFLKKRVFGLNELKNDFGCVVSVSEINLEEILSQLSEFGNDDWIVY